jgi:hypothetical protein
MQDSRSSASSPLFFFIFQEPIDPCGVTSYKRVSWLGATGNTRQHLHARSSVQRKLASPGALRVRADVYSDRSPS